MPGDCAPAGLIYSRRRDRWEPESKTMQEDFTVKNIKCGGCVKAIQNGLQAVAGVAAVDVTFSQSGKWYVRSIARPTTVNANSVWSPVEWYEVVPLTAT